MFVVFDKVSGECLRSLNDRRAQSWPRPGEKVLAFTTILSDAMAFNSKFSAKLFLRKTEQICDMKGISHDLIVREIEIVQTIEFKD